MQVIQSATNHSVLSPNRRPYYPDLYYAGDGGVFKTCSVCQRLKSLSSFNAKACRIDGKRAECRECQGVKQRKYAAENTSVIVKKNLLWRHNNIERVRKRSREHARKQHVKSYKKEYERLNFERLSELRKEWRKKNSHKRKIYNDKQVSTAKGKLEAAIRVCVRSEIRNGSKGGRKTFDLLGYSTTDLMNRLESLFQVGMSWENYGRGGWHVDHIIPLSSFKYETPDDPDFKRAWALSNLQPLWQFDNLSKGSRMPESNNEVVKCAMLD